MKILNQFTNKSISSLYRLGYEKNTYKYLLAESLFIEFKGFETGLFISIDSLCNEIIVKGLNRNIFSNEKISEFGQIHDLKKDDLLNSLSDQTVINFDIFFYQEPNLKGDGFIIERGEIQQMIINVANKKLVLKISGDQIWTDVVDHSESFDFEILGTIHKRVQ